MLVSVACVFGYLDSDHRVTTCKLKGLHEGDYCSQRKLWLNLSNYVTITFFSIANVSIQFFWMYKSEVMRRRLASDSKMDISVEWLSLHVFF